ncbi:hypothetical protein CSUB01_10156 [Colletotrichum sublineola]|uniref:Myb/SANT-like domain-containing protein n=1 Tax=Colletotrichum sublineola TaxID=1173701 RepID=A0A066X6N7_COLSU|nr:hypothetical protein CSUB01_10156 [Colletotrichum sublineola]
MNEVNPQLSVSALYTKYRHLLAAFRKVKTLIRSGVGYDNDSGIITTSDESWEAFEKRFPQLKSIRSRGFPYMDEMGNLWPEEVATGQYIVEAGEANDRQVVVGEEEAEEEEEDQSAPDNRRRKRREEYDPDVNPLSSSPPVSEIVVDSQQLTRRKMARVGKERHDTLTSFGQTIERGLGGLSEAMVALATPRPATTTPREPGSDDISKAIEDYQQLFGDKLDNRVAAKVALFFAKSAHTAVAWLAIKSVDGKEEFLREVGIIE